MRPSFHPRVINDPFNDPGLFIPFLFDKRAVIFDIGDINSLSSRDILKISHVFVTHTHIDHFCGFDRLLRLMLGREKQVTLFGPEGFLNNVEGKLAGYSWNLVNNFSNQLIFDVTEIQPGHLYSKKYMCGNAFHSPHDGARKPFEGTLLDEPAFTVSTILLDHGIPCLGFSIQERFHINIMKDKLKAMGLAIGPWIRDFKERLFNHSAPESEVVIESSGESAGEKKFLLGDLCREIAIITPGQKVSYIADVGYNVANAEKIISFVDSADHLFIEAAFLEKDRDIADKKKHLTARQAGSIAGKARVKQFTLFHFSPRYMGREHLLREEAQNAFDLEMSGSLL